MRQLIDKLKETQNLTKSEWIALIENRTPQLAEYLFIQAQEVRRKYYGNQVFIRGLIEFTNYCKNDCLYCGIQKAMKTPAVTDLAKKTFFLAAVPDTI